MFAKVGEKTTVESKTCMRIRETGEEKDRLSNRSNIIS
jgi:hypothetical protein